MDKGSSDPFFIVGAQRSGTTLLRLILNSHSEIAIPEEGTFWMPLLENRYARGMLRGTFLEKVVRYLENNPQLELWATDFQEVWSDLKKRQSITLRELMEALYGFYARKEKKSIWGDKTPSFFRKIEVLKSIFPEARFIHIVRDGRDVFESWRTMDPAMNNPAAIALDWSFKVRCIQSSFARLEGGATYLLRYEDLISRPEECVRDVCSFLGVDFQAQMLQFFQNSHTYIGRHHSKLIFRPIEPENREKWKRLLHDREKACFSILAGKWLRRFGYEVPYYLPFKWLPVILPLLVTGLARRAAQVARHRLNYVFSLHLDRLPFDCKVGAPPEISHDKSKETGAKGKCRE